jgi:hypothetical protein
MNSFDNSILRILGPDNRIVGTGFLVASDLAVTCAHVVIAAEAIAGDTILVQFTNQKKQISALVEPLLWLDENKGDIALLRLTEVPDGIYPLRLAPATDCRPGSEFRSFGYATAADVQGLHANGTIDGYLPAHQLLQLQSPQADKGISGAPVLAQSGVVLGMITKGHQELGRNENTTFATPSEVIWQVCPDLRPVIPPLPRRNPIVEGINLLPYDYDVRIQNFLTEYLGTESHPVPFGGRDDALKMLDAWLAETTPYLLLAAPAGRGKSALLVRWLDSLKAREDLALAFVPVSIRFGTNMERVFYAALAARLAFVYGDDIPASPETSTAVYRGLVSDYLSKPLANGRTLLVVLDGLDEAADWQAGADFMPGELPAGVRVVVSARFLAGDSDSKPWVRRLNWERNGLASVPSLIPLDRTGVGDVLLKMGCPLDELSRKVNIVAELYRLSQGDPLLVGLYVGDLWSKGKEVSRLNPEDLADIQPGYKGYFDRWWDDQKELWGKDKPWLEKHVRTVRNLLAGALAPLFIEDLQALTPELVSDYVIDALDVLRRFVVGDNQTQGYTFSHPKLAEYFWEILTESERAEWEKRFLDWGENTIQEFIDGKRDPNKKKEIPFYVVSNYTAHLTRTNQPIEKWLTLIHYQQWAQAWFTLEGAYGGYSQDVLRVWEQCRDFDRSAIKISGKAPHLVQQIRCAFICASLHSLGANIPRNLLPMLFKNKIWGLKQILVTVRQTPDPSKQKEALIEIIPYLDKKQMLEVLDMARTINDELFRVSVLEELAQYIPEINAEMVTAVRMMKDSYFRSSMLCKLASRIPEFYDEALESALLLESEMLRTDVLCELAEYLPEAYLFRLLDAASVMQGRTYKASLLITFIKRLPELKLVDVLNDALKMQDDEQMCRILVAIVPHLPQESLIGLVQRATSIHDQRTRARLFIELIQHLSQKYRLQILEYVRAMDWKDARATVLAKLAQYIPDIADEALETTLEIQNESMLSNVLIELAELLPKEHFNRILELVRAIQSEQHRVNVLSELIVCQPHEHLTKVHELVRGIKSQGYRAKLLVSLVKRLPGLKDETLITVRAIQNKQIQAAHMSNLALIFPDIAIEAINAARYVQDNVHRIIIMGTLAQYLPDLINYIIKAVKKIPDDLLTRPNRQQVLVIFANCLPEQYLELVLDLASELNLDGDRAYVLSALAKRMPENSLKQILWAAHTIRDPGYYALVLESLIPRISKDELEQVLEFCYRLSSGALLGALADRLSDADLITVIQKARQMKFDTHRASLLTALAKRKPDLLHEALNTVRDIKYEEDKAHLLSILSGSLPNIVDESLKTAQQIGNEQVRARALSKMVPYLPEEKLLQVLEYAYDVNYEEARAILLTALAQRNPTLTTEALKIINSIKYQTSRTDLLSELVRPIINNPVGNVYEQIEGALQTSSLRTRADLFFDCAALMPVIKHIGTPDTPREIYEAVRDVTTWWP